MVYAPCPYFVRGGGSCWNASAAARGCGQCVWRGGGGGGAVGQWSQRAWSWWDFRQSRIKRGRNQCLSGPQRLRREGATQRRQKRLRVSFWQTLIRGNLTAHKCPRLCDSFSTNSSSGTVGHRALGVCAPAAGGGGGRLRLPGRSAGTSVKLPSHRPSDSHAFPLQGFQPAFRNSGIMCMTADLHNLCPAPSGWAPAHVPVPVVLPG